MSATYTIVKDTPRYTQLENLLVHIASENNIKNVEKIAITMSQEECLVQFKEASESYDEMALEQTDGVIVHTIEADHSNPNVVPKAHIKLPNEILDELSKQDKIIRVDDSKYSPDLPGYGLHIFLKSVDNFTSFAPVGQVDKGATTKDITSLCQIELV